MLPRKTHQKSRLAKKGLTGGDSLPQTPLAFLGKCSFKDHFMALQFCYTVHSEDRQKDERQRVWHAAKGPKQDLHPRCYYFTQPVLCCWSTQTVKSTPLTQPCLGPFQSLCTTLPSIMFMQLVICIIHLPCYYFVILSWICQLGIIKYNYALKSVWSLQHGNNFNNFNWF